MAKHRWFTASILLALLCGQASAQPASPTTRQSTARSVITDSGAIADATTLNTAAIQKTIDQLASVGGGTVVIPKGVFRSGSIFLKPGVNLHLEKDAVLKGSTDIKDYPMMDTRIEGHFQQWLPALVNADKNNGMKITGEGTLDGSGEPFWAAFRSARGAKNLDVPRPRLMFIRDSNDITISGIRFKDSGFWNLHVYRSRNVLIENLDIRAGARSPSADGIDIDSCQYVTIKGCTIYTNDDCIALKGTKGPFAMQDKDSPPVEHIRVMDCTFERGNSFVTCGSEATIVRDVIVERCKAVGPDSGGMSVLRLKLRTDTPQLYEDMHFRDITLQGNGSMITMAPWSQYFDLMGQPQPSRHVRNISVTNVTGSFGSFGSIQGGPGDVIEDIVLENIDVKLTNPRPRFATVKNLVVRNVKVNGEEFTVPTTAPTPAAP